MLSKKTVAAIIIASSLTACAALEKSEATHILSGKSYPPSDAASISIYIEKPDFNFTVIGIVEARGMGVVLFTGMEDEKKDQELAMQALKREAASIGADGVIISDSRQGIANISKSGSSTERRIKGLAIRRQQ